MQDYNSRIIRRTGRNARRVFGAAYTVSSNWISAELMGAADRVRLSSSGRSELVRHCRPRCTDLAIEAGRWPIRTRIGRMMRLWRWEASRRVSGNHAVPRLRCRAWRVLCCGAPGGGLAK